MTIYSDIDIRRMLRAGLIRIDPMPDPDGDQFQPASVDLTLGSEFKVYDPETLSIDAANPPEMLSFRPTGLVRIAPHEFMLGTTAEKICLNDRTAARVEGKSSLARMGLQVHITAGFIDPGFEGQITLEFVNNTNHPIQLRIGQKVCQIAFEPMSTPVLRPYGHPRLRSHYQHQEGTTSAAPVKKELD